MKNNLAELKGIGPKHAEMLKSCGVDSIKELRHRTASHLKEMIEQRHAEVIGLSVDECQTDRRGEGRLCPRGGGAQATRCERRGCVKIESTGRRGPSAHVPVCMCPKPTHFPRGASAPFRGSPATTTRAS